MKIKNIRDSLQTVRTAKSSLATRLRMWEFAKHGKRRFRDDPRYDLQNVTEGFKTTLDAKDDTKLLERICAAYGRTLSQQELMPAAYKDTEARERLRSSNLRPVIQALFEPDTQALGKMYKNFYRDPCSSGLLAPPNGMANAYFGRKIKDIYRCFYLSHVLYRFDYWELLTEGQYSLRDLAGPGVGNPFGVSVSGTHISVGAEYAHYCAQRIGQLLPSGSSTVSEIGGGFGGMAYFLIRDYKKCTYVSFDVPENAALSSYYLMKSFPDLKFLLYGEDKLTQKSIAAADVVIMPLFELPSMPSGAVDVTFSSHGLAKTSPEATTEYLRQICRTTKGSFLNIGSQQASNIISSNIDGKYDSFDLATTRVLGWHSYKVSGAGVGGAAGLAASTLHEQLFKRRIGA